MSYRDKKENENLAPIGERYPWVKRRQDREDMVRDYLANFKNTMTFSEALKEGYDIFLLRFVAAVADIQAQMIIPEACGVGWDGMTIFGGNPTKDDLHRFLKDQQRQANIGHISVAIPTGRIAEWKQAIALIAAENQRAAGLQVVIEPTEKTRLDLEIERQIAAKSMVPA